MSRPSVRTMVASLACFLCFWLGVWARIWWHEELDRSEIEMLKAENERWIKQSENCIEELDVLNERCPVQSDPSCVDELKRLKQRCSRDAQQSLVGAASFFNALKTIAVTVAAAAVAMAAVAHRWTHRRVEAPEPGDGGGAEDAAEAAEALATVEAVEAPSPAPELQPETEKETATLPSSSTSDASDLVDEAGNDSEHSSCLVSKNDAVELTERVDPPGVATEAETDMSQPKKDDAKPTPCTSALSATSKSTAEATLSDGGESKEVSAAPKPTESRAVPEATSAKPPTETDMSQPKKDDAKPTPCSSAFSATSTSTAATTLPHGGAALRSAGSAAGLALPSASRPTPQGVPRSFKPAVPKEVEEMPSWWPQTRRSA